MKLYNNLLRLSIGLIFCSSLSSCLDELDQSPLSKVAPEVYFRDAGQLESYVNNLYQPRNKWDNGFDRVFAIPDGGWSYEPLGIDSNSDNMASGSAKNHFIPGEWKVDATGGEWSFEYIYKCNYFFNYVLPLYEAGEISGDKELINHYIGEVYFLRAYEYFKKLKKLGDLPIITEIYSVNLEDLTEKSKRQPRTEVIRFILSDLNKAAELMKQNKDYERRTRLNAYTAEMFKSRVALYEASWLKYFKGTAFVPNGEGWPGASLHTGYSVNIDALSDSLYQVTMDAAKIVADNYPLVENNGVVRQTQSDPSNPYHDMFGSKDPSVYSEVIFWKEYAVGLTTHNIVQYAQRGNQMNGLTRGYVDNFLLADGKPLYTNKPADYDDEIGNVRRNRDGRLSLFLKEPGQYNVIDPTNVQARANEIEGYPDITNSNGESGYSTGYTIRKGNSYEDAQVTQLAQDSYNDTGIILFRSAEAYLNYMEACYEKNGSLDGNATAYWNALRDRAHISGSIQETAAATDISKEAENDWAAYSAGSLLNDNMLYSIRRERRSELLAEGLRLDDLRRWRALDQLIDRPYHIEGIKFWGGMHENEAYFQYNEEKQQWDPKYEYDNSSANVSSPNESLYLRPYEISSGSLVKLQGGVKWAMAHYLDPIAAQHFLITSGGNAANSTIYQNPYWSTTADSAPLK